MARPRKTRVAYVTFPSSWKTYVYRCPFADAKVGDIGIVDTPSAGLTRVTIRSFGFDDGAATKSILAIEDISAELEAKQKELRKKQIQDRLNEIQREVKRKEMLTALARKSPEARKLLKELESL